MWIGSAVSTCSRHIAGTYARSVNASDKTGLTRRRHTNVLSFRHILRLSSAPKHHINLTLSLSRTNFAPVRTLTNRRLPNHRHIEYIDGAALCPNKSETWLVFFLLFLSVFHDFKHFLLHISCKISEFLRDELSFVIVLIILCDICVKTATSNHQ